MQRQRLAIGVIVASAAAAATGQSFTPLGSPPASEPTHAEVLENLYGGSFSTVGSSNDLSNGAMTARRIADAADGGSPVSLITGAGQGATDQSWSGGPADIGVKAHHAGDNHTFGWINDAGAEPGSFTPLADTSNIGQLVSASLSPDFRWALRDDTTGSLWTSRTSDNLDSGGDAHDRLVSYSIEGDESAGNSFLLFWDDRINGQAYNDNDFNDAVLAVAAVPAPGGAGVLAIGGIAATRRRR